MRYDLRFWAEYISPPEIVDRALGFLSEYRAGVGIAIKADSLTEENALSLRRIKEAGVETAFWPLMSREDGYFPYEANVPGYSEMVRNMVEWSEGNNIVPDLIAFDLELPFDQMMYVLEAGWVDKPLRALEICRRNLDRGKYLEAKRGLIKLNSWVQARGIRTLTAALPWVALELNGEGEFIQDMMETPIRGVGWDLISPMWYVSMIEGMTGGTISRRDAEWITYLACLWLRTGYGKRAGVSLGLTGTGVFGDEPVFDEIEGIMVGVEAALAAGIRDVSIYNLEGTLDREDPGAWFRRLREASPRTPDRSRKMTTALAAARVLYPLAEAAAGAFSEA